MQRGRFPGITDGFILALILLILFLSYGEGDALAVIAAVSIIGLPIAVLLWSAPFVALVCVPWRGFYLLLGPVLPGFSAALVSLGLAGGGLYLSDSQFPRGPHPELHALLFYDDPVTPIAPLPDGRLSLEYGGTFAMVSARCDNLCDAILSFEQVSELVLIPQATSPVSGLFEAACLRCSM